LIVSFLNSTVAALMVSEPVYLPPAVRPEITRHAGTKRVVGRLKTAEVLGAKPATQAVLAICTESGP
jgi:hypothetical protein